MCDPAATLTDGVANVLNVEVLDAVDGREEWSVKIVLPPASEPEQPPAAAPSSGAEFLRRRRAEVGEAEQRQEQSARVAEDAHHELGSLAEASRLLPPQDPRLAGYAGSMVLNAAYLVPHDDAAEFAAGARSFRRPGGEGGPGGPGGGEGRPGGGAGGPGNPRGPR